MSYARIRQHNQVTLPDEVSSALHVQEGDLLEVTTQGNQVVLKPTRIVAFGTPEGEEEHRRAMQDLREGRSKTFESVGAFAEYFEISGRNAVADSSVERLVAEALNVAHGDAAAAVQSLERALRSLEARFSAGSAQNYSAE